MDLKNIPLQLKNFLVNSSLLPFWYVVIYIYLPSVYNTNDRWLIISFCICLTLVSYIVSSKIFIYVEEITRRQEAISIRLLLDKLDMELKQIKIHQKKNDDELVEVELGLDFFKKKVDDNDEITEDETENFKKLKSRVEILNFSSKELKEKLTSFHKRSKSLKKRMKMLRKKVKKIELEPLSIDIALPNALLQVNVLSILIFLGYIWDLIFGCGLLFYGFVIIYFSILISFSFILKKYYKVMNIIGKKQLQKLIESQSK